MLQFKSIMFIVLLVLVAVWLIPSPTQAQMVKWKDIIGIIEAGNTVGSGTGQVTGGSEPWSTSGGSAKVNLKSGKMEFIVMGLVFAGATSSGPQDQSRK